MAEDFGEFSGARAHAKHRSVEHSRQEFVKRFSHMCIRSRKAVIDARYSWSVTPGMRLASTATEKLSMTTGGYVTILKGS